MKCWKFVGLQNVQDTVNDFDIKIDTDDYRDKENEADDPRRHGSEEANDHSEGECSVNREDFLHSLDITDESTLDGEVGRRLNQLVSVPVSLVLWSRLTGILP